MMQPPNHITDPLERAAWMNLQKAARRAGIWEEPFVIGLELAAGLCARYVRLTGTILPRGEVEETRLLARKQLYDWHFLPLNRESIYPLTKSGHDADIFAACGVSDISGIQNL